jgi:uncharacterized protein YbjT (DUF2867 family)
MGILLVTGASGYVGRAITARALASGWRVRTIARNPMAARRLLPTAVEVIPGDLRAPDVLRSAVENATAVIHLTAISYERGKDSFESIHVHGTRKLLEAVASTGVERIIYMSALGSRPNATSRFLQSRWAAEQAIRDCGLNWAIIRPSLVLGPGDYFVSLHLRLIRTFPFLPVIGKGDQLLQPIALDNLAHATMRVLDNPAHATYDAVGPLRLRLTELQNLIMKLVGRRRLRLHIPIPLAQSVVPLFEHLTTPPMLTRDQLLLLREDNIGDPGPLQRLFQHRLQTPQEALGYLKGLKIDQVRGIRIG